jgi:hypothetical protein
MGLLYRDKITIIYEITFVWEIFVPKIFCSNDHTTMHANIMHAYFYEINSINETTKIHNAKTTVTVVSLSSSVLAWEKTWLYIRWATFLVNYQAITCTCTCVCVHAWRAIVSGWRVATYVHVHVHKHKNYSEWQKCLLGCTQSLVHAFWFAPVLWI